MDSYIMQFHRDEYYIKQGIKMEIVLKLTQTK